MLFLQTQAGLIAGKHVVRIGALTTRATGNFHDIDYIHGSEARYTRASQEDVEYFLSEQQS